MVLVCWSFFFVFLVFKKAYFYAILAPFRNVSSVLFMIFLLGLSILTEISDAMPLRTYSVWGWTRSVVCGNKQYAKIIHARRNSFILYYTERECPLTQEYAYFARRVYGFCLEIAGICFMPYCFLPAERKCLKRSTVPVSPNHRSFRICLSLRGKGAVLEGGG